jgi:5-methylcytosine-specific restriction enzyme subunit McrC
MCLKPIFDCLSNQIIRTTAARLARNASLDSRIRHQIVGIVKRLDSVAEIRLTVRSSREVQLHGNNRVYKILLNVCELVFEASLIGEGDSANGSSFKFRDFIRDEKRMVRLFENFIFNFLRTRRRDLTVTKERIRYR